MTDKTSKEAKTPAKKAAVKKPVEKDAAEEKEAAAKKAAAKKPAAKAKKPADAQPKPKHVKGEAMEGFVSAFGPPSKGAPRRVVSSIAIARLPAGHVPPKPAAPAPAAPAAQAAPAAPPKPAVPPMNVGAKPAVPGIPAAAPRPAVPPTNVGAKPAIPGAPAGAPRPALPPTNVGAKPAVPGAPRPVSPAVPPKPGSAAPAIPARPAVPGAPAVPAKPPVPGAPRPGVPGVPPRPGSTAPAAPARPGIPGAPRPGVPGVPPRPGQAVPPRPAAPGAPRPAAPGVPPRPPTNVGAALKPAAPKPAAPKPAAAAPAPSAPEKKELAKLKVQENLTVRELAEKMGVKPNDVIKKLISMGVFASINQRLDNDAAELIAADFGFELETTQLYGQKEIAAAEGEVEEKPENLKPRPPVVTVMGHVDHGKTSLLDAIRDTDVAGGEAGAITQHIGAYKVKTPKGELVFLDTPGHEAFTAMRARGVKATDIVILVVSATDGVQPQTIEAIDHAKAAGVPIVVAINKIDLPGANPQKIKQELAQHGVQSEDWGGKTIMVEVSAKKRLHLDTLLEMVLLETELLQLKANPTRPGTGTILEARLDPKRGPIATVLVQSGTLKVGDSFVVGINYGRVRALIDDRGNRLETAGPSTPVEILGIGQAPQVGDVLNAVADERQAREIAEKRKIIHREEALAHQRHVTLLSLRSEAGSKKVQDLKIVLKADVQGSIQALKDTLEKQGTAEIVARVIHSGTGNVSESDVLLAKASDAIILAFNVETDTRAADDAERSGIEIRTYRIIYDLLQDVRAAMEGLLVPEIVDQTVAKLEVRQVFSIRNNKIAGCFVLDGKAQRAGDARVLRGGKPVHTGRIAALKRFKDDVKEVEKGMECGLSIEGWNGFEIGDTIEVVVKQKVTRRLEPAH